MTVIILPTDLHRYTQPRALRNAWLRDIARLWVEDWDRCSSAQIHEMYMALSEPVEVNV